MSCALLLAAAGAADAKHASGVTVAGPADVRVWIDGGDVFPDYRDVTIWVRADRDCYSTLFLVDTAGYIHVLYPNDRYGDGWMDGGRAYGYRACDLGLDRLDGRGIAYVFAVGSPVPFDYGYYGEGVFVGRFGYRIVGDPFVACRQFYVSLLPGGCRWDYVGVGFTRFYVREWVRYPSYLCYGGPGFHVRIGESCRVCADVYTSYRCNVAAPYEVIQPVPRFKHTQAGTTIRRSADVDATHRATAKGSHVSYQERTRVVSTSRTSQAKPAFTRGGSTGKSRAAGAPELARNDAGSARSKVAPRMEVSGRNAPEKGARQKGAKKRVRQAE
jgi:hypothetical protein